MKIRKSSRGASVEGAQSAPPIPFLTFIVLKMNYFSATARLDDRCWCKSKTSMKNLLVLAITAAMLLPGALHAAQTAQARMFCLSLRFQPGQSAGGSTLHLSTYDAVSNGELAPNFDPSVDISHVSLFQLQDSSGFGPI